MNTSQDEDGLIQIKEYGFIFMVCMNGILNAFDLSAGH